VNLTPEALAELRAVMQELRRSPLPVFLLDPRDYALDACREVMARVREATQRGPMFAVLEHLPMDEMAGQLPPAPQMARQVPTMAGTQPMGEMAGQLPTMAGALPAMAGRANGAAMAAAV
jgi:hypothetical protein